MFLFLWFIYVLCFILQVEYWRIVKEAKYHVAAQGAQVDTKICGSGFPTKKDSPSNVSPYSR